MLIYIKAPEELKKEAYMNAAIILLAAHFIGDWVLQSRKVATTKSKDFGSMMIHATTIFFSLLVAGVLLFNSPKALIIFIFGNTLLHITQDSLVWSFYAVFNTNKPDIKWWEDYWFYTFIAVDQFVHISWLFISYYLLLPK